MEPIDTATKLRVRKCIDRVAELYPERVPTTYEYPFNGLDREFAAAVIEESVFTMDQIFEIAWYEGTNVTYSREGV
jgi:hypothetical protein